MIHFVHRDFMRCKIMDKHLDVCRTCPLLNALTQSCQEIAPKYPGTRFIRVMVENAPWLVDKLGVQVLPCVVCFIDGKLKHRYN